MLEVTVSSLLFCLMLSEHLLIMQLKEKEVNRKIEEMVETEKVAQNLSDQQVQEQIHKLKEAKKDALQSERDLLNSIDGPMKLTQYLINVILVNKKQ